DIEDRSRRRGVLVDDERQFAFYDARIPEGIWSGARFEAWRRRAEKEQPRLLYMTRDELLADAAHSATLERFPDHLVVDGARLPLEYRFEPGHEDDGVTLSVPAPLLRRLSPQRLDWLVPGMIEEKVAALIKT